MFNSDPLNFILYLYSIYFGSHQKYHTRSKGGGDRSPKDHRESQSQGGERQKNWGAIKKIITPRIGYQWVVEEVISSKTNIDLIRIALTKRSIFWMMV